MNDGMGPVIDPEASVLMPVFRTESTFNDDGDPVDGPETTTFQQASIQPATKDDTENLPEGYRDRRIVWIFAEGILNGADDTVSGNPDIIEHLSRRWEVISKLGEYRMNSLDHTEVLAVIINDRL